MHPFLYRFYVTGLCFNSRDYRNNSLVFTTNLEVNCTIYQSEKSVVLTHTDVVTRVEFSTSLTNDDVTGFTYLTTVNLNT